MMDRCLRERILWESELRSHVATITQTLRIYWGAGSHMAGFYFSFEISHGSIFFKKKSHMTPRPGASPAMPAGDRDLDRAAEELLPLIVLSHFTSTILLLYPNILLEE
jgi:hypothetical protein